MNRITKIGMAAFLFLFFSLHIAEKKSNDSEPLESINWNSILNFSTLESLYAAQNAWGFVRQSATWAKGNSDLMDQLLTGLIQSGLLTKAGTYTATNQTLGSQAYKIRLTVGSNSSATSTAFSGSKTFSNKFELWRQSDGVKALELFFDQAGSVTDPGALMLYDLKILDPTKFTGNSVVVETYIVGPKGSRLQTYSWSGGPIVSGGPDQNARVVVEEMESGDAICFKSVVKFNQNPISSVCTGSGSLYYNLAYVQNLTGSNEATAKFSVGQGTSGVTNQGTICGVTNTLIYGIFDKNGFISDGNSSVSASFPPTSKVDTLFSEIGTTGSGPGDDTTQSKIDGLSINFVDPSTAPF